LLIGADSRITEQVFLLEGALNCSGATPQFTAGFARDPQDGFRGELLGTVDVANNAILFGTYRWSTCLPDGCVQPVTMYTHEGNWRVEMQP